MIFKLKAMKKGSKDPRGRGSKGKLIIYKLKAASQIQFWNAGIMELRNRKEKRARRRHTSTLVTLVHFSRLSREAFSLQLDDSYT